MENSYQIRQVVRKGDDHPVWCQDNLAIKDSDESKYLFVGVFDGCSKSTDSHFASQLCGKIMRECAEAINNKQKYKDITDVTKQFLYMFVQRLKQIRNYLKITNDHLRSTCIFHIYDKTNNISAVICLGDGLVCINGEFNTVDMNNLVEYPIDYPEQTFDDVHNIFMDNIREMRYNKWFEDFTTLGEKRFFIIENPKDISISSDGISSFSNVLTKINDDEHVKNFLLVDTMYINRVDSMLATKHQLLKKEGFVNKDDLSIVRTIFSEKQ